MGCIFNQSDRAFRNRLCQMDLRHMTLCNGGRRHGFRIKSDAKIVLHHGQDLIHGGGLHIHMKGEVMLKKQLLIKRKSAGSCSKADEGTTLYILKSSHFCGKLVKIGTAEKNFPKGEQCGLVQRFLYLKRRCDHSTVYLSAPQGFYGPWGGVVGNAEMNAGIGAVKSGKPIQQEQVQGGFAGGNGDAAGFQTAILADLILSQTQLLERSGSPSGIREIPRLVRMKSLQPRPCSRLFMQRVILGWLLPNTSAARVKLLHWAT